MFKRCNQMLKAIEQIQYFNFYSRCDSNRKHLQAKYVEMADNLNNSIASTIIIRRIILGRAIKCIMCTFKTAKSNALILSTQKLPRQQ